MKNMKLTHVTVGGIILMLAICNLPALISGAAAPLLASYLFCAVPAFVAVLFLKGLRKDIQLDRACAAGEQYTLNPTAENWELFMSEYEKYRAMK